MSCVADMTGECRERYMCHVLLRMRWSVGSLTMLTEKVDYGSRSIGRDGEVEVEREIGGFLVTDGGAWRRVCSFSARDGNGARGVGDTIRQRTREILVVIAGPW